jgi:hypothetical protein
VKIESNCQALVDTPVGAGQTHMAAPTPTQMARFFMSAPHLKGFATGAGAGAPAAALTTCSLRRCAGATGKIGTAAFNPWAGATVRLAGLRSERAGGAQARLVPWATETPDLWSAAAAMVLVVSRTAIGVPLGRASAAWKPGTTPVSGARQRGNAGTVPPSLADTHQPLQPRLAPSVT